MPRLLKDIRVNYISLVRKGANNRYIILKSSDEEPVFNKDVEIKKEIEGVVYGIVYAPDEVDSQGDYTTKEEIKKAAYEFMKSLHLHNVDKNHDFQKRDAFVAESWIVKKGDPVFPKEKEGSWAVGIKIEDESLLKEIQKGEITGISMAGYAKVKQQKNSEEETNLMKEFVEVIKRAFNSRKEDFDLKEIEKAIKEGLSGVDKEVGELREKLEKIESDVNEMRENIKKSKQNANLDDDNDIEGVV